MATKMVEFGRRLFEETELRMVLLTRKSIGIAH